MNKKILAGAVLSVLSFEAMADTPSFDYFNFGYTILNLPARDDAAGFELRGSKSIYDNFYITGEFLDVSKADYDRKYSTVGLGYKNDFSDKSSFFIELDYYHLDTSADGFATDGAIFYPFDVNENGYTAEVGFRSMITEEFEVMVAVKHLDIFDRSTTFVFGSAYNVTEVISIYADLEYKSLSGFGEFGIGARLNF